MNYSLPLSRISARHETKGKRIKTSLDYKNVIARAEMHLLSIASRRSQRGHDSAAERRASGPLPPGWSMETGRKEEGRWEIWNRKRNLKIQQEREESVECRLKESRYHLEPVFPMLSSS
jgi:hypothetical protein